MTDVEAANWRKLSPGFRRTQSRRRIVRDLKAQVEALTARIASARVIARAIADARQKEKPMAGGTFFALIDEIKQSEERLDKLAEPLLKRLPEVEARAKKAIETKHATLDAQLDYLDRLEGKTKELEASNDGSNRGPSLKEGSAESPKPSGEQSGSTT